MPLGTLVAYTVSVTKLIGFTGGYRSSWPPLWQVFGSLVFPGVVIYSKNNKL